MECWENDVWGKEMIYKGYRINEKRKKAKLYICNCVYGHMNCKCDGNGGNRDANVSTSSWFQTVSKNAGLQTLR